MKNIFLRSIFFLVIIISNFSLLAEYDGLSNSSEALIHLPTGRHVIADLKGCEFCHYQDDIEAILRVAASEASATILKIDIETFPQVLVNGEIVQGMTGTVILSESHIAFHTWPEHGFVACDIFTCGSNALPEKGLDVLINYFKPKNINMQILPRGMAAEIIANEKK